MLTADQLMDFEERIEALIAQLESEIANSSADTAAVAPDNAIGRISRMDSMLSQGVAKAAVALKFRRITALEAARLRLDDGTYGFCENCGGEVEYERLEAAPEATRCSDCC